MGASFVNDAVGAAATLDAFIVSDAAVTVDDCDLDHRRRALQSVCRRDPGRELKHSSSLGLTESSPLEQIQPPGLPNQNIFYVYTRTPSGKRGNKPPSTLRLISRAGVVT